MPTWSEWKQRNQHKIQHVAGFEEMFVDQVLAQISLIQPEDVTPQYHFRDERGGNRYIDFMILNPAKGYCIPIELDGLSKLFVDGREYEKFNDFLERQNALIAQFGLVLRYTNKKMLNNSQSIIDEITETLNRQSQHKSLAAVREQQIRAEISDYQNTIAQLQQQADTSQNNHQLLAMIQQLKTQMAAMSQQLTDRTAPPTPILPPGDSDSPRGSDRPQVEAPWWSRFAAGFSSIIGAVIVGVLVNKVSTLSDATTVTAPSPQGIVSEESQSMSVAQGLYSAPLSTHTGTAIPAATASPESGAKLAIATAENPKVDLPEVEPVTPKIAPRRAIGVQTEAEPESRPSTNRSVDAWAERKTANPFHETASSPSSFEEKAAAPVSSSPVPMAGSYTIGEFTQACGEVAQAKGFAKGTYLNLGASYPRQDITLVLWRVEPAEVEDLIGSQVCASGRVKAYKNKPQIELRSRAELQVN